MWYIRLISDEGHRTYITRSGGYSRFIELAEPYSDEEIDSAVLLFTANFGGWTTDKVKAHDMDETVQELQEL